MNNRLVHLAITVLTLGLAGPASAALVAHWPFNNSPNDQVGALHWTLNGGAVYSTDCKEGSASLVCDGVNDYASLGGSGLMSAVFTTKTVMLWFKPNATTGTQVLYDEGGSTQGLSLRINNGALEAAIRATSVMSTLSTPVSSGVWSHVAVSFNNGAFRLYLNGKQVGAATATFTSIPSHTNASGLAARNSSDAFGTSGGGGYYGGLIDDVRMYDQALTLAEIRPIAGIVPVAANVSPKDSATDVPRDATLNWTGSEIAATHDVYFGAAFADVNSAARTDAKGVLASQGQAEITFDPPGLLAYGQTYYWRIDEVNKVPDSTVFRGDVWSFTVEPYGYPVKPVAVTASSFQADMGPEKTIDGSGLTGDLHGTEPTTMWMSAGAAPNWIQYEFDRVYKLHELQVWNSNQLVEAFLGFGAKSVTVETSVDGTTWTPVAKVPEFSKASGAVGYAANTTVSFGVIEAKFVKLTITANWGGVAPQVGLSEVRFSYVPVQARAPQPATAATGVSVNPALDWRPGRGAASHKVFFGTDPNAVANGTAAAKTVSDHSYTPDALNLSTTYYWRVDEVNAVTYPGAVWSFTTQDSLVVDDFESYTDQAGEEIFSSWIDGFADNYKSSGSTVGLSTAVGGTFGETTILHSGKQSMPLAYDNTKGPGYSEATLTFDTPRDWTANGVKSLSLWFRGIAGNAGQLYVKINAAKVLYDGDAADLARVAWSVWNIDLSKIGKVNSVRSLTIGIEGAGAKGTLYVDDIRLYARTPEYVTPAATTKGPVAYYRLDGDYKDASGNGRNGTAVGGPTFAAGQSGQALSLDGTGDYITIDNWQGILGGSPFTISLWVNSTAVDDRTMVCWGGATNGTRVDFRLYQGRLRVEHGNGNIQGNTVLADGQWHHVALVVTQGATLQYPQVTLYLDGANDTQGTADPDVFGTAADVPVTLGQRRTNNDRDFQGMLDEVRLFDVVLSAGEVAGLAGRTIPLHKAF